MGAPQQRGALFFGCRLMSGKPATIGDFMKVMERWAPAWSAESWDKVGLQVGDPAAPAPKAWTALELDERLLATALEAKVALLLVHHPVLFQPLEQLRVDQPATARLIKAASASLAAAAGRPAPDDRQTERLMAELMATRAQLRRYGNNVNQIARTLNAGAEPPEWLTSAIALTDRVVHNIDRAVQDLLEQPRGRA